MKILENKSFTLVKGIKAAGISCGLKKSGKKDLCLIYSEEKGISAGAFTQNQVKAAPVLLSMKNVESENVQALIINSGNANACNGAKGYEDAVTTTELVAKNLNILPSEVLVQSTGIIGLPLPMDKLISGINNICPKLSKDGGEDASLAILTTDTFPKTVTVQIEIDNKTVTIAGIAKGSGMIHPNMATMLGNIFTDVNISKELLNETFKESIDNTFNMISVDGDTSTNDMCIIIANGAAENKLIDTKDENFKIFKDALDYVNESLAKLIAKDGEGATKLLEVSVSNGKTKKDSKLVAKSIITSNLTKCAFFGEDANWGRILCAIGYSKADLNIESIDIHLNSKGNSVQVVKDGAGLSFDEDYIKNILEEDKINILVDLKNGKHNAKAWGCDLSYEYVKINGSYRS
ncbi:bifunctional glutamate N-acetyltransferase/amino-acid acetyltransferase ArgJ [Fusobacterium sp. IOR10]|uniref:bifunctional glutamate N-acetyltransferase/amino-acid acetyltransferase ArgJ n=1 Tax=Fusobacterium sp. IOR10 TaxID=2665157 RepID=UPI0013D4DF63|nr:bifunctional glutamate N-acetyltransferase/amino-acid acetyltransferase ArgJ [Fusobacterium sp. IOR10]